MKKSTRIFLKSFTLSLTVAAALATFIILTQIPSYEKKTPSSSSPNRSFEPSENDKFNLLVSIAHSQGDSPYAYFILGFNGRERQITVTRLFPETLLSYTGQERVILKECFQKGGAGGAARALSNFFSISLSKYICFTDDSFISFCSLFDDVIISVPENLSQTDRKNDIYIKIDKGNQIMGGLLMLDYITYSRWDGGAGEALFEGSRVLCEFMRQNHSSLALSTGSDAERFILGSTQTNLSITDIEERRELLSYLLKDSTDAPLCLETDGNFGVQDTEFTLSSASIIKISARHS